MFKSFNETIKIFKNWCVFFFQFIGIGDLQSNIVCKESLYFKE